MAHLLLILIDMCIETTMTKLKPMIMEGRNKMGGILHITETYEKKMIICFMAVLFVCFSATASFASWSQGFSENGIYGSTTYSITKIEVFKLSGNRELWKVPVWAIFQQVHGQYRCPIPIMWWLPMQQQIPAISTGFCPSRETVVGSKLELAYLAYTSTGEVFGTYLNGSNTNNTWSYPMISNTPLTLSQINDPRFNRTGSSVPIPPAVFLFSGGLFGLVGITKKNKSISNSFTP